MDSSEGRKLKFAISYEASSANLSKIKFKDLLDELKSELSGNMEDLVVAMMLPNDVFCARELEKAMKVSEVDIFYA